MKYSFHKESAMELRPLRFLVLWPHKAAMEECLLDADFLATTQHFSIRDEKGEVSACCSVMSESREIDGEIYNLRLRAMVVHPNHRRQGLGKQLLIGAEQFFLNQSIWCDAREVAVLFYKSCGWKVKSEVYQIPIIGPHYLMVKNVMC